MQVGIIGLWQITITAGRNDTRKLIAVYKTKDVKDGTEEEEVTRRRERERK